MLEEKPDDAKRMNKEVLEKGASAAALGGITFITEAHRVFGANDRVRVGIEAPANVRVLRGELGPRNPPQRPAAGS